MQPSASSEATYTTVWPTIAATSLGRMVGRLMGVRPAWDRFQIVGKLAAAAMIPVALAVFVWQLMPFVCRRYRLTNRRLAVQAGLKPVDRASIGLDAFDSIEIDLLPGQEPLHAEDLVFRRNGKEVFRLPGVSRPQTLAASCRNAQRALLSVRAAVEGQTATPSADQA